MCCSEVQVEETKVLARVLCLTNPNANCNFKLNKKYIIKIIKAKGRLKNFKYKLNKVTD